MVISVDYNKNTKNPIVKQDGQILDDISDISFFGFENGKHNKISYFLALDLDKKYTFKVKKVTIDDDQNRIIYDTHQSVLRNKSFERTGLILWKS